MLRVFVTVADVPEREGGKRVLNKVKHMGQPCVGCRPSGSMAVTMAHRFTSGELNAGSADIHLTQQLLKASEILDHLILGNGDFSSLQQTTILWQ